MRLLYLGPDPAGRGGVARSLARVTAALAARGHTIRIVHPDAALFPGDVRRGGDRWRFGGDDLQRWCDLALDACARDRPDVIVGYYGTRGGFCAAAAGAQAGVPSVVALRGNDVDRDFFRPDTLPLLTRAVALAGAVTTVSTEMARKVERWLGRPATFVSNSVDRERFYPDPEAAAALRARWGLGDRPVLGLFGELKPKRGLDRLIPEALPGGEGADVGQPHRAPAARGLRRRREGGAVGHHPDPPGVRAQILQESRGDRRGREDQRRPVEQRQLQPPQPGAGVRAAGGVAQRRLDAVEGVDLGDQRPARGGDEALEGGAYMVDVEGIHREDRLHPIPEDHRPAQPVGLADRHRQVPPAGRRGVAQGHQAHGVILGEDGRVRQDVLAGALGGGHRIEGSQDDVHRPSARSMAAFSARKSSQPWQTAMRATSISRRSRAKAEPTQIARSGASRRLPRAGTRRWAWQQG